MELLNFKPKLLTAQQTPACHASIRANKWNKYRIIWFCLSLCVRCDQKSIELCVQHFCSRKIHNIPETLFSPEKSIVLLARSSLGMMVWCDVLICGWARERKESLGIFIFEQFYLERHVLCYGFDFISFHFMIVTFLVQWNRYAIENA